MFVSYVAWMCRVASETASFLSRAAATEVALGRLGLGPGIAVVRPEWRGADGHGGDSRPVEELRAIELDGICVSREGRRATQSRLVRRGNDGSLVVVTGRVGAGKSTLISVPRRLRGRYGGRSALEWAPDRDRRACLPSAVHGVPAAAAVHLRGVGRRQHPAGAWGIGTMRRKRCDRRSSTWRGREWYAALQRGLARTDRSFRAARAAGWRWRVPCPEQAQVYVLDEPTTGLDVETERRLMAGLRDRKTTAIVASSSPRGAQVCRPGGASVRRHRPGGWFGGGVAREFGGLPPPVAWRGSALTGRWSSRLRHGRF